MLKKKVLCVLLIMICIINTVSFVMAEENVSEEEAGFKVNAKSAIIMEPTTGKILFEQNAHEPLGPASVTKVMTLLLTYEAVESGKISWDDVITISEHAASMGGSQVFLSPEEQIDIKTLTKCIAVASGNDAAVAMAETIAGSEEAFVEQMNRRAKELGMNDTHFVNPTGLDAEGHVTSAHDIAVMSRELTTRFPEIHEFTTIWHDTLVHKRKDGEEVTDLTNTNKLLQWYKDATTGLKTGSTKKQLYSLSGTAEKNGLKLIAVVMSAPDWKTRFDEVIKLFEYGFANYEMVEGEKAGKVVGEIKIVKGQEESVPCVIKENVNFLLKKGSVGKDNRIETKVNIEPVVSAPVQKGVKVGEVIYTLNEKEVGRSEVITQEEVQKANIQSMIRKLLNRWF